MALFDPPASFYFAVSFTGSLLESGFQEVSGLKAEWSFEDVAEGGQNRYVHRLPVRTKYSPLTLKRGVVVRKSEMADWLGQAFKADFATRAVVRKNLVIMLLNRLRIPVVSWSVVGAYPVSWDHSTLNSNESSLLIETIELSYAFFERTTVPIPS